VIDELGKEQFAEQAYDAQVKRVAEIRKEMVENLGQVAKKASKDLPADERRQFAELLRRPSPR
jgi:hypothetical protein